MRKVALITAKLMLTAVLLWFAVRGLDFQTVATRLQQADPAWLVLAFVVALLQNVVAAIRWKWIADICGASLTYRHAIRFNLIGLFFNQSIPSNLSGDAARIWLAARAGAGWSKAAYSVLIDRFVSLFMLATVVTAGLYWSSQLIQDPVGRFATALIGLGAIAVAGTLLALGRWRSLQRWTATRHLAELTKLARRILNLHAANLPIIAISLLTPTMTAVTAWSLGQAIHSPFEFTHSFLLVPPVILIASAPVSIGGWGVRESALVVAFSYAGLPRSDGLIISVLFGVVMLAVSLLGGLLLLTGERLPRTVEPAERSTD